MKKKFLILLQHQKIKKDDLKEQINIIYNQLVGKYEKDKSLVPEGNLIEIKFEDLLKPHLVFKNRFKNVEVIFSQC